MPRIAVRRGNGRRRDSGYMLLVLMLAVAVLTIAMLGVTQNYRRSIVRDREVEMIHRGVQYERAVQRYYRKFGNYPPSMEALENTSKIRFLRKRYKDPMSPDGQWQIAHITDIKIPGFGGLMGTAAGASQSTDGTSTGTNPSGAAVQTTGTSSGSGPADSNGTAGNGAGPVLGGGPMLGVISKSKAQGIHSFNDTSKYNEWYFIYDPNQDKITNGSEPQITGPYNPKLSSGLTSTSTTSGGQTGAPVQTVAPTQTGGPPPPTQAPPTTPSP